MNDIKLVIEICIKVLNTRLTFAPYSFTIMQAFLAIACLAIIINFIVNLFDN